MNSKKMYRIEQMATNSIASEIITMAAMSNGTGKYIPLQYMADFVKVEKMKYPTLTEDVQVTISGNTLLLDRGTTNLLAITEVEVLELVNEDAPTLNRFAGTGIADENNKELLN